MATTDKGSMTASEAGRKGGEATAAKLGHEHYVRAGTKGGAVRKEQGADYHAIGRKGGEATLSRHGADYYVEMGRRGGQAKRARKAAAA